MGRKSNNTELEAASTGEASLNVDGNALGIVKDSNGHYLVVALELDSSTGASRITKSFDVGSSKMEAAERFKVLAVEEGLVV